MNERPAGGEKKRPKQVPPPPADAIARVGTSRAGDGWRKRRRITDGLIGLSSAIVLSVYTLGYLRTRETDEPVVAQNMAQSQIQPPSRGPSVSPASGSQQAAVYRDGTYVASARAGTDPSRHV